MTRRARRVERFMRRTQSGKARRCVLCARDDYARVELRNMNEARERDLRDVDKSYVERYASARATMPRRRVYTPHMSPR